MTVIVSIYLKNNKNNKISKKLVNKKDLTYNMSKIIKIIVF